MAQAKILTEAELKRALAVIAQRRHAQRDRLALLLTHWAGMRVCEVAALTLEKVVDSTGNIMDEFNLGSDQTKGDHGRVVMFNSRLKREISQFLKSHPMNTPKDPLLLSQKATKKTRGFTANTMCQLINGIYREAGIKGATSHAGRRGFITALANAGIGVKVIMELAGHRQLGTTQRYIEVTPDQKRKAVELL